MNIIDVVIILLILLAGVVGFKRGFFQQVVMTIGIIIVFILSFQLKNPVADFLMSVLPFFNVIGTLNGVIVLNIILYQLLAFLIVSCLLTFVLNLIIKLTGLFEKLLKFTIILGIPSKILGFIVGLIEGYVSVFIFLFFLNQPAITLDIVKDSKLMPKMLENTPVLTGFVSDMNDTIKDVYSLKEKYQNKENMNQFNLDALDTMLKYDIITPKSVEKLIENGKLNEINGIDSVLNNYR